MIAAACTPPIWQYMLLVSVYAVAIAIVLLALLVYGPELLRELRIAFRRHRLEHYDDRRRRQLDAAATAGDRR